jgi:hypothetical protein
LSGAFLISAIVEMKTENNKVKILVEKYGKLPTPVDLTII